MTKNRIIGGVTVVVVFVVAVALFFKGKLIIAFGYSIW